MKTSSSSLQRIWELLGEATLRFTAEDESERDWLVQRCAPELAPVVEGMSVQALHLLDAIAEAETIKVVALADSTGVPKGTVSKVLQRLVADGVVQREQLPNNRKEVLISLTDTGAEIQRAHRSLHEEMNQGFEEFLERYSEAEREVLVRVLDDLVRLPRDGLRFRPDLL